ncbi:DEAD/DEAH box helicase [Pseudoalteromonas sp. T1lg88]|uniref:DEAD/DEAH box helicase n=1 Tax=Pseudoalteromonas sp. T1lg88 TaxID=2077104 RepID=UPI000CF6710B|nr:DEAD/DEAH box helicase [Pseudoalteromonas sp. T1lg88]
MAASFTKEDLLAVFAEINAEPAPLPLSEQALKQLFSKGVYSRAQQMLRDEQVLWVKSNEDYSRIEAQVLDDDGTTYDQHIQLQFGEHTQIEAHCSCQAKVRCKHVASALLQLKLQSQGEFAHQYQIDDWFCVLAQHDSEPAEGQQQVLLFELHPHQNELQLQAKMAPNTEAGLQSQGRALSEQQSHTQVTPKGLDEGDFRLFSWIRSQNLPGQALLYGHWGARALVQLLARARLFFEKQRQPLLLGKPQQLQYQWIRHEGKAKLTCNIADFDADRVFNTAPPYYLDSSKNQIVALHTHLSGSQIKQLAHFPEVNEEDVSALSQRLDDELALSLSKGEKKKPKLGFTLRFMRTSAPYLIAVEGQAPTQASLANLGLEPCKGPLQQEYQVIIADTLQEQQWLFELEQEVQNLGGKVISLPRQRQQTSAVLTPHLVIDKLQGHRFLVRFELHHKQKVFILSAEQLANNANYSAHYCYLECDGQLCVITSEAAKLMLSYLQRFASAKEKSICSIPRSLYPQLTEQAHWQLSVATSLAPLLQKPTLSSLQPVKLAPNVQLREYQQAGVNWLQLLSLQGLGAVLADDMGLGKTLQVIAYLSTLKPRAGRPHLILCPTSLIGNWCNEIKRFCPQLSVQVVAGNNRTIMLQQLAKYEVLITTYTLFKRDFAFYHGVEYHTLVLDEAQAIKNAQSQLSQKVKQLRGQFRLALSGTPFENNLLELKSVFDFAMPSLLGSDNQFKANFLDLEQTGKNALKEAVRPYLLRRAKADVLSELPSKTELVKQLDMLEDQAHVYQGYHSALHQKLSHLVSTQGIGKSKLQFLDALLKLRQICCHPGLVDPSYQGGSAKLQWLQTHLPQMLEQEHHVIIFSQFTSMLSLIGAQLQDMGIDYALLTGQTRDRQRQVDDFQQARKRVFLISLKAGGSGLNLTQADTVIHFDPWWNPAVEHQATDRAYRMGQDRSVFVYKLILADSVEQQVQALAEKKRHLVDEFLNGSLLSDKKIDDNQLLEMLNLEKEEKV